MKYRKIMLGNSGAKYIVSVLKGGKTLAQEILQSLDFSVGVVYTYLPFNVSDKDALEFNVGGKVPVTRKMAFKLENGSGVQYEGFDSVVAPLVGMLQEFLHINKAHLCVFEDALSCPSDDFIKRHGGKFFFLGGEVYHYLQGEDTHEGVIRRTIDMAGSEPYFLGALTSYAEQNIAQQAGSDFLKRLAMQSEKIVVSAYDGEGYLIWEKS